MRLTAWTFLLASAAWGAGPKQPVSVSDLLRIQRITEVAVAPDGSFAVYGLQTIHTADAGNGIPEYSYRTHIWRVDLPSGQPRQLTFGARTDSSLALSPDGSLLAFVRSDYTGQGQGKPQVWLMPLNGPGEARRLTRLEYGAHGPVWHPDGKSLLAASAIPLSKIPGVPHFATERPGRDPSRPAGAAEPPPSPDGDLATARAWLDQNASRANPAVIHRLAFQDELELRGEYTVQQLFRIDAADGHATPVTRGFYSFSSYSYSPGGLEIAALSSPQSKTHPDRLRRQAIWRMDASGANLRPVLDTEAENPASARWLSDAELLVLVRQNDEPTFRQARLARLEISSGKLTTISEQWEPDIAASLLASDGSVLFVSPFQGAAPLKRLEAGRIRDVVSGPVGVSAFDEGAGRIVYAQISVTNPSELYLRDRDGSVRQITAHNKEWLAQRRLALPTEKWIRRPDGTQVQYWMMHPHQAEPGKRYPVLLNIHGGPHAMWGPGEFSMWHEFQVMAGRGYGVVYANPRGSSGYGYAFQKANYRNWAEGPAGDVLAALEDAVAHNPLADPERLYLTGGSYGGYLTAWILAHSKRFSAAAAQRGVYDLATFYGEGNAFWLVRHSFGGRPFEPEIRSLLDSQSPFTHVAAIRTPLLILHGSQDLRTGVAQSEMLFRALSDLERPVEYVRYPGVGHELTRSGPPHQRMDHLLRILEFFARYPGGAKP